jgi:hypothetical protein
MSTSSESAVSDDAFQFVRKQLDINDVASTRGEFCTLDYTPSTVIKPVDLVTSLRPTKLGRKIRVLICVTAFNEDGDELKRTLGGIAADLPNLQKAGLHVRIKRVT